MKKQELDHLLDQYVLGKISSDDDRRLQLELIKSPSLKKDLNLRLDLVKSMEYIKESELRKTLDAIHEEEIVKPRQLKKKRIVTYSIIGLLLLAGILYFINIMTKPPNISGPIYFASNYEIYKSTAGIRGEKANTTATSILELYTQKQYTAILNRIKTTSLPISSEELLIAGNAAIQEKKWDLAIGYFDQVIMKNDYFFNDHALWYKALCHLQLENISLAKEHLLILLNDTKADHHLEAKALLSELQ